MGETIYLKNAGSHCCPSEGPCVFCSCSDLAQAFVDLVGALETFTIAFRRARAQGQAFTIRPWRWQRDGVRRNRSFRARRGERAKIYRFPGVRRR